MGTDDSAEAIQKRMAELRRELTCDVQDVSRSVHDVGRSARQMTNPLYLIRRFPWTSAAVAVGIGYLLVPKKKQVITPDPEMLAELIRKHQIRLDTSKPAAASSGMLKNLAMMGLTWAARTGFTYVTEQMAAAAMNKASGEPARSPEPAPEPQEEPWNTAR